MEEDKGQQDPYAGVKLYDILEGNASKPLLLTDEQMQFFIMKGYLVLPTFLPSSFHSELFRRTHIMKPDSLTKPGNNILPLLPDLLEVYESPTIKGALISILGPNYAMHPHRHAHATRPGSKGQKWHKDSYWGYKKPRHHVPRWVMAMYYPQKTTLEMGPTAVYPYTQYFSMPNQKGMGQLEALPKGWGSGELPMTCEEGTVVIIAYDIWHRAMPNTSFIQDRYMFKFQFVRMEEPERPTWDCKSIRWDPPTSGPDNIEYSLLCPVWRAVWNWLTGNKKKTVIPKQQIPSKELANLKPELYSKSEGKEIQRLHGAYTLGLIGDTSTLKEAILKGKDECIIRNAAQGLLATASDALPCILSQLKSTQKMSDVSRGYLMLALGELGASGWSAVDEICSILNNDLRNLWTRQVASETLGMVLGGCCPSCDVRETNESEKKEKKKKKNEELSWNRQQELLLLGEADDKNEEETNREKLFDKGVRTLCKRIRLDSDDQIRFQSCLSLARVAPHIQHQPGWNKEPEKKEQEETDDSEDESEGEESEETSEEEDDEKEKEKETEGDEEQLERMCLEAVVVGTLANAIRDSNRYVRGYAKEALMRFEGSEKASTLVMKILLASAWCSRTNECSPYYP